MSRSYKHVEKAQQIPKYDVHVQSSITLAACILKNIAHSGHLQLEYAVWDVREDDPWSPLSFSNMNSFHDFIHNAM